MTPNLFLAEGVIRIDYPHSPLGPLNLPQRTSTSNRFTTPPSTPKSSANLPTPDRSLPSSVNHIYSGLLWSQTVEPHYLELNNVYELLPSKQKENAFHQTAGKVWSRFASHPHELQARSVNASADPRSPATFFLRLPPRLDLSGIDPLSLIVLGFMYTNVSAASQQQSLPVQSRLNATDSIFESSYSQAARMPPQIDQGNHSVDHLQIHGGQMSVVSRPSLGSAGSVRTSNYQQSPGSDQLQGHMSMMSPQDISRPTGFDQRNGYASDHARPSHGPQFVPSMLSQPRLSSAKQPNSLSYVGDMTSNQTASRVDSHLDGMVNSSSSMYVQPLASKRRRLSSPLSTSSADGFARVSASEIPSKFAVVLDSNRNFSAFTPGKSQNISGDVYDSPRGPFTSMKARVEIPASTPERLARKAYAPSSKPMAKKKGRPFATPASAQAAADKEARKIARENGEYHELKQKKAGRPAKSSRHVEVFGPEPKYQVFVCEWAGCPAELHNADTLRKHLHIVHGKKDSTTNNFTCRWKQCELSFSSRDEWKKHVEGSHMRNVLLWQGEGPKVTDGMARNNEKKSLLETDPWLFDANGKQVTPSVENQEIHYLSYQEAANQRWKKTKVGSDYVWDLREDTYKKDRKFEKDDEEDNMKLD